jgi:hypothetical protein
MAIRQARHSGALPRRTFGAAFGGLALSAIAINELPDMVSLERAARIVAPMAQHVEERYFEGGAHHILRMLGRFDVAFTPATLPADLTTGAISPALNRKWFADLFHERCGHDCNNRFLEWAASNLFVSRSGILAHLSPPSGQYHAPVENVDTAGASWSFPQALAWIATREPIEVARMEYLGAWGTDSDNDTRRRLIGWLVLQTSLKHCSCGSVEIIGQEPWETCRCVGHAYDALRVFAKGKGFPIPTYQPRPAHASFTLTWPEGAHNLSFARAEILERWSPKSVVAATAGAESDCKKMADKAI